ncbi:MAG: Eco57I restriction-modification methylase domain-containing protein, partial [Syntrophomonadaceae bacterium]
MSTAKLTILKETFEKQFDIERFKKFTREFFNEPQMLPDSKRTGIWKEYLNHIKSYNLIAKYTDSDNNNLIVLAVELEKDSSIDRARSMQRNFISKVLDENQLEACIVAFYTENDPSWRLSFVRLDYSFKETGISLDLTPARRYSYLLGENEPNNTAQAQLLPIFKDDRHNPTLDEIEEAFTVEKVTKEFFSLYKEKYFSLKEYLENDAAFIKETHKLGFEVAKFSEQFAKKLMGQLAFLYFLQKKGWLGVRIMPDDHTLSDAEYRKIYTAQDQAHKNVLDKVFKITKDKSRKLSASALFSIDDHEAGLLSDCFIKTDYYMPWGNGNRTFIREIFDFCTQHTNKNFFDDYLEPLFYEALNTKRKNHYFKTFNCKIPFLNGGLFEPLEGYHWRDVDFNIPNELFSNKTQKGRDADGILDVFDRFNFTINEDEPLEKEVAVDPEMLGKIFENLLDVSDRKSKGAFYTPREIVHYMCQESLINYLVNEVSVPYEDMKEFILYGELIKDADSRSQVGYGRDFAIKQSIYDNIVKIDDALKNVKVADPAVGSGAFPLGMLNEIVRARNNITEYIIRKDKEGFFNRKFGEDFIRKWRAPYKMKWDTIKNSIFAVDIEPSAVDIAKLRLWLAVVVEQEIDADNPEPHPLPNLDMNIHIGNSLIDEYEGIKLFDKSILDKKKDKDNKNNLKTSPEFIQMSLLVDHTDEILQEMFTLQDRYFDEDNDERKKEIKEKIDNIRDELIRYKLQRDNNADALKSYEDSLKNKTRPYFIWEMEFAKIFKEKGGFDIVIGNPPYYQLSKDKSVDENYKLFLKTRYGTSGGRLNTFIFFIHLGYELLKTDGVLAYIIPNTILTQDYYKDTRRLLIENTTIKSIVDYEDLPFENAVVENITIIFSKDYTDSYDVNIYKGTGNDVVLFNSISADFF